jgi:hypothetical protein
VISELASFRKAFRYWWNQRDETASSESLRQLIRWVPVTRCVSGSSRTLIS